MGVIAFGRPPQEALEQIKQALGMVELIHHIATNPDMGETIKDLSLKLTTAQTMSIEKQKQAAEAEEVIAQAKEHLEEIAKQKADHEYTVSLEKEEIVKEKQRIQTEKQLFEAAKTGQEAVNKKMAQEAAQKLADAVKYNNEGALRHAKAEALEKTIAAKIESHQEEVSEWNRNKAQQEAELNSKWEANAKAIEEIAANRRIVETQKKKLDAALNA